MYLSPELDWLGGIITEKKIALLLIHKNLKFLLQSNCFYSLSHNSNTYVKKF